MYALSLFKCKSRVRRAEFHDSGLFFFCLLGLPTCKQLPSKFPSSYFWKITDNFESQDIQAQKLDSWKNARRNTHFES